MLNVLHTVNLPIVNINGKVYMMTDLGAPIHQVLERYPDKHVYIYKPSMKLPRVRGFTIPICKS